MKKKFILAALLSSLLSSSLSHANETTCCTIPNIAGLFGGIVGYVSIKSFIDNCCYYSDSKTYGPYTHGDLATFAISTCIGALTGYAFAWYKSPEGIVYQAKKALYIAKKSDLRVLERLDFVNEQEFKDLIQRKWVHIQWPFVIEYECYQRLYNLLAGTEKTLEKALQETSCIPTKKEIVELQTEINRLIRLLLTGMKIIKNDFAWQTMLNSKIAADTMLATQQVANELWWHNLKPNNTMVYVR